MIKQVGEGLISQTRQELVQGTYYLCHLTSQCLHFLSCRMRIAYTNLMELL